MTSVPDEKDAQFIAEQLSRHNHFVLSTIGDSGAPWCVYLGLAYDERLRFIWQSRKDAEHSKHLRARPQVALGVFSKTDEVGDFGLYCKAKVHEVTDEQEITKYLQLLAEKRGKPAPNVRKFIDDGQSAVYTAEVVQAWLNDSSHIKREVGLGLLISVLDKNN